MVVIMIICGGCVVGVPLGIIGEEFSKMVSKAAQDEKEEEDKPDMFKEFSDKLTIEQKMAIVAQYKDQLPKEEAEKKEE